MKHLRFDHTFIDKLPADPVTHSVRRQVVEACYSFVSPKTTAAPKLLIHSPEVAELLDLSDKDCHSDLFTQVFSGNALLDDMKPYAMCYGGHQFGNWAGQLGDGRAIVLGDVINNKGERWTLQLKGAGETPYSRSADGLAVLRSSIREFLCSEAMFHLGVPTTRALSLCATGDQVWRDMFYDGHPEYEHGAVVCRVAPSFLRFGSFEIFAARNDLKTLKTLLDFTIRTYFPHLIQDDNINTDTYTRWFAEVCDTTKTMIIHWQRVGFVHGVMNTDNMSIHGLTIDYGPYGWLEDYNPDWTPNTTDATNHRYAFGKQAHIAHWNLMKLAQAIAPLFSDTTPLQDTLNAYAPAYKKAWQTMMQQKLGLNTFDEALAEQLMNNLERIETDMTIFFRKLADISAQNTIEQCIQTISPAFYGDDWEVYASNIWKDWFNDYLKHIQSDNNANRKQAMNLVNPKYVLRNYLAQLAIDKADSGDVFMLHELFEVLKKPYAEQPEFEDKYAQKRPDWAKEKAGCSMLSCSS
ncbi:protein adenylyltransferase SelO [Ghiorsea bivora]|uniref:protein adenylyltransferase SelO n=1 Tax=Ghiorsea bivora TaxID=1485545 RepID=UPI00057017F8|nr:YdiU family protein [Ghiorsea bivora]